MTSAQQAAPLSEASAGSYPGGSPRAWDLILASLGLLIVLRLSIAPWVANHDAALHLDIGRMLLEGKRPYIDVIDTNPPMIMYLSVIPAWIAKTFSLHLIPALHLFVVLVLLGSVMGSRALLRRCGLGLGENLCNIAAGGIAVFSWALMLTPDMDWGQREHLYLLLYLPFFYCRWIRWEGGEAGWAASLLAGAAAALGTCIKPHFVVAALSVESIQALRGRRLKPLLKPEMALFVGGGLAYALHFAFLPEEVRAAFFGRWLPLVARGYVAYDQPWSAMLMRPGVVLALMGSLAGWLLARPGRDANARLAGLFAILGAVSLLLYLAQQKGWLYHQIPAMFGGAMAAALGVFRRVAGTGSPEAGSQGPTLRLAAFVVGGTTMACVVVLGFKAQEGFRAWPDPGIGAIVGRYSQEGDPVLFVSTQVGSVYPLLLQLNRRAASRYITTFPPALIYGQERGAPGGDSLYHSRETMGLEESRFLEELGADIARVKPPMILIDAQESPQAMPEGFTFPGYFEAAGFLEREMEDYREVETAFNFLIFVRDTERARP